MKIMHLVLSMDVGGLERVVLSLVGQALAMGHDVSVLCLERPGDLSESVEALAVKLWCVDKPAGLRLATIGRIEKVLRQVRPEVVHTHQIGALFYGGPAAKRAGVPVVVHTEHGMHFDRSARACWLGWWAARRAQRFFCVSPDIARAVVGRRVAAATKVLVVPNGIDTRKFQTSEGAGLRGSLGIPAGVMVIGTVGRLVEIKRQDVLIRGFARLRIDRPTPPHLVLVGNGPLEDELRRLTAGLGVAERVHFMGYQNTPEEFLGIMDIFAMTSRSEGMPLAILEAWATGLPVVASRVGGVPELIEDGRTGLLFDSGDEIGLAGLLETLGEEPQLARRLADAGRHHVCTCFDVSVMAQEYHRHYVELLGQREISSVRLSRAVSTA